MPLPGSEVGTFEAGSTNTPRVGILEGSKLFGSLTCFLQLSLMICMPADDCEEFLNGLRAEARSDVVFAICAQPLTPTLSQRGSQTVPLRGVSLLMVVRIIDRSARECVGAGNFRGPVTNHESILPQMLR